MIDTPYKMQIRTHRSQGLSSTEWDVSALTNQATTAGLKKTLIVYIY